MPFARSARLTAALVAAAASLAPSAYGAASSDEGRTGFDPVSERAPFSAKANPLTAETYTGVDGQTHKHSPILIRGKDGAVFFGEEFDAACGYGKQFNAGLARMSKLAKVIEKSGRRVVFAVPPNKSAVSKKDILKSQLPHGKCDLLGIAQQDKLLDGYGDPNYVSLRKTLAARSAAGQKHLYWPIDTHWTRLGAAALVQGVAAHLDPALAARQTARKGRETIETDVSYLGVIPETRETGPAVFTTTKVRVKPVPGSVAYDPTVTFYPEHEWKTKPASKAWPGRTLVLGDSFVFRALDNLMPLFESGHFLWNGHVREEFVLDGLVAADTVVIAVTQRYLPIAPLTRNEFINQVRTTLGTQRHQQRLDR